MMIENIFGGSLSDKIKGKGTKSTWRGQKEKYADVLAEKKVTLSLLWSIYGQT